MKKNEKQKLMISRKKAYKGLKSEQNEKKN